MKHTWYWVGGAIIVLLLAASLVTALSKGAGGSLAATVTDAATGVKDAKPLVLNWTQSLPVVFASTDIGPYRGTEARSFVFSHGSLYAAIGDWQDPELNNPNNPGAQILRLDSPNGKWVTEYDFNQTLPGEPNKKNYEAVGALSAVQLTENAGGQSIAPVDALFAGVWSLGDGLDMFQKIGDNGTWTKVTLVGAAKAPASLTAQVRSFAEYTDSVTGKQLLFAGTNPFGIFDGIYNASQNTVVWNTTPESGSFDVTASPAKGASRDRVMSFTTCDGRLYASVFDAIIMRTDGPNPSWQKIYEYPGTLSFQSSGFRGLTCVPNTHGPGNMLIAALESDPLQIYDIQINRPYTTTVEFNVSSYLTNLLGTPVGYGVGAYNDMAPYPSSAGASCPDLLIGLSASAPKYPNAYQGVAYPYATFLIRHCDGTYAPLQTISDPSISPAPSLEATRTMIVSQFPSDPAGTLYAGGFDGGYGSSDGSQKTDVYNTDWIYKGVPAATCPTGDTGTYPNCVASTLLPFYALTYPEGTWTNYFFTSDQNEENTLITPSGGWSLSCSAALLLSSTKPPSGSVKWYRLYNISAGTNLYTAWPSEVASAETQGYVEESGASENAYVYPSTSAQPAGTVPLYRLRNLNHNDYYYTTSASQYATLGTQGWAEEGIVAYVYASNQTCVVPAAPTTPALPLGNFDGLLTSASSPTLYGWAFDPKASSTSINVDIYVDGPATASNHNANFVTRIKASTSRTDINTLYAITGNHGFQWTIPAQYQGASHTFYIYAINSSGTGPNPLLSSSPQIIVVPASTSNTR